MYQCWNDIVRHAEPWHANEPWNHHSALFVHAIRQVGSEWLAEVMDPGFGTGDSFRRVLRGTSIMIFRAAPPVQVRLLRPLRR